jgi:anti-sigma B factor antagonist
MTGSRNLWGKVDAVAHSEKGGRGMDRHRAHVTSSNFIATLLEDEGGTPIVSAFGEIDASSADDLDILTLKAISKVASGGSVIVDLGGVEFMDCAGLRVLINAQLVLDNSGGSLAMVCGPYVRRLFEASGMTENFELYEDLISAAETRPRLHSVS